MNVAHGLRFDVAVVGGGPAGSAAAVSCAQRGLSVVLVDRAAFPRHRPGESLHPGIEPLFNALGVGDAVREAGFPRHPGHWIERGGELIHHAFGADRGGQWLGFQALRSRLDSILLEGAKRAGVKVLVGTDVCGLMVSADGRVTGIQTDQGPIVAQFTVDASGGGHWLARKLKVDIARHSPRLLATYGYSRGRCPECEDSPIFRNSSDGWTWLARIGRGVYAWASISLTSSTRLRIPEVSSLRSVSKRRGADVTWRILRRTAGRGWFTAGDAASVCDPAAAQGVLRALSSGMMIGHLSSHAAQGAISQTQAAALYDGWLQDWFRATMNSFQQSRAPAYCFRI